MIRNIWDELNGRKTAIGAALFFVLYGCLGLGYITQAEFNQIAPWVEAWVGVGLLHKGYKEVTAVKLP